MEADPFEKLSQLYQEVTPKYRLTVEEHEFLNAVLARINLLLLESASRSAGMLRLALSGQITTDEIARSIAAEIERDANEHRARILFGINTQRRPVILRQVIADICYGGELWVRSLGLYDSTEGSMP